MGGLPELEHMDRLALISFSVQFVAGGQVVGVSEMFSKLFYVYREMTLSSPTWMTSVHHTLPVCTPSFPVVLRGLQYSTSPRLHGKSPAGHLGWPLRTHHRPQ